MVNLSIVIPAYNEASRIVPSLTELAAFLQKHYPQSEVLIVDDGSSDETSAAVRSTLEAMKPCPFRLITLDSNRGKGYAVKTGVMQSTGDTILFMDADLSTPLSEIEKVLAPIAAGSDVAIGSRGLRDSVIVYRQPIYRETMGRIFNLFVRLFVIGGIADTQCGFKAFRADAAKKIFSLLETDRFGFDVEVLLIAKRLGMSVKEIGVRWRDSPNSRVAVLSDSVEMFLSLFSIRRRVDRLFRQRAKLATQKTL